MILFFYGLKNAKHPNTKFSTSKFKSRATRCTLMSYQTPILKISELWHLWSWLGRRNGEKPKAVKLELGHYVVVGTVKKHPRP